MRRPYLTPAVHLPHRSIVENLSGCAGDFSSISSIRQLSEQLVARAALVVVDVVLFKNLVVSAEQY